MNELCIIFESEALFNGIEPPIKQFDKFVVAANKIIIIKLK